MTPLNKAAYQRARALGLDHDTALAEARLVPLPVVAPPVEQPMRPAFSFERYDDGDRRLEAAYQREQNPQLLAWHESELQRISAARVKLADQIDELQRQDRALAAEQAKHLVDSPF